MLAGMEEEPPEDPAEAQGHLDFPMMAVPCRKGALGIVEGHSAQGVVEWQGAARVSPSATETPQEGVDHLNSRDAQTREVGGTPNEGVIHQESAAPESISAALDVGIPGQSTGSSSDS